LLRPNTSKGGAEKKSHWSPLPREKGGDNKRKSSLVRKRTACKTTNRVWTKSASCRWRSNITLSGATSRAAAIKKTNQAGGRPKTTKPKEGHPSWSKNDDSRLKVKAKRHEHAARQSGEKDLSPGKKTGLKKGLRGCPGWRGEQTATRRTFLTSVSSGSLKKKHFCRLLG